MTTEHQACGLGSFLPMSCRGRAEAFARRLQSRLQSLGRAGSGDGASSPDESSWLAEQQDVTSNQPRHSSSSDSDVYFDFDLDCESPGSPVDEVPSSESLPDFFVNKSRAFHCPPRTQYSSESGCVLSPSTLTGSSPGSDSSDGPYFDPEISDSESSTTSRSHHENSGNNHESHTEPAPTQGNSHIEPTISENGNINGYTSNSPVPSGERKLIQRRNFRNAAGFRISSPEKEIKKDCTDTSEDPSSTTDAISSGDIDINRNGRSGTLSNDSSTTDEYFECGSLKSEESLSEDFGSLCVHDSGYPNTAESSRCNSQNDNRLPQLEPVQTDYSSPAECEDSDRQQNVPNGDSNTTDEQLTGCSELQTSSLETRLDTCRSLDSSDVSEDSSKGDNSKPLEDSDIKSSSESYTSTLYRPCNLTLDCSASPLSDDSNSETTTQTKTSSKTETNTEEEDDDDKTIPRVRRCSSLKTGKTPPGTPGRKKIVRFADVLGLDLADIRTFLDEIPKVPRSAYEDLECTDIPDASALPVTDLSLTNVLPTCINAAIRPERCLIPLFEQPGGQPDFMDRVRDEQVCLENAIVTDSISSTISGTVRVRNLDFHKSVHIRYTLDGWKTFADLQATYVQNTCDGFSDKFTFTLYAHTVQVGQRLEFAVRFQCRGAQYWDSNGGNNYVFQCLPPTNRSTTYATIPLSPIEQFPSSFY